METRSNHVLVGSVVLILLTVMALFIVWLARLSGTADKEYDIFFKQSVNGINKGSNVSFSGVASGQVKEIALFKEDPQFVRVRISVNQETPVLQGTTATIQGVGFTGVSEILLDGAIKNQPPISCPSVRPQSACPFGVPVIPTRQGGLGALLSSAPQLLERLSNLAERLTDVLSDKNMASLTGILDNTNRVTKALADRSGDLGATIAETRVTIKQTGEAAAAITRLANSADGVLKSDIKPVTANLNKAIASAQHSLEQLDALVSDARPGVQAFSKQTVPEVGQLVHDLRIMAASLTSVAEKIDQGGAGSILGAPKLPNYTPGKAPKASKK
ncbi:MlaD family protein [Sphingomonas sp. 28-63-12]|uniref:MlaD family protein n=1 Tax=Sphingomonas sp. 28-63-12 TaxID=1970434 RepID=UPI000BC58215|nr:MAG: mammalian cell entry protein [Sphingomonas sp. 28-63-12]